MGIGLANFKRRFANASSHSDVHCFSCGKLTTGTGNETGFGPGDGMFRAWCEPCGMFTWYDVIEDDAPTVEALTVREVSS